MEDRRAPRWRPDGEYASEGLLDVISSRSALSAPGTTVNESRTCNPLSKPTTGERNSAGA